MTLPVPLVVALQVIEDLRAADLQMAMVPQVVDHQEAVDLLPLLLILLANNPI